MRKIILYAIFVVVFTACNKPEANSQTERVYTIIQESKLNGGELVPVPVGDVVLTISGKITRPNVGNLLQFDMETLERLGIVAYSVDDKQAEGRTAMFQGVLLSQLLDVAGVEQGATVLHTVALNDYAVDIPLEDVESYPLLLATAVDGQRMTIERYGPIRIIYPYHAYDLNQTLYDPRWIWQLETIEVR